MVYYRSHDTYMHKVVFWLMNNIKIFLLAQYGKPNWASEASPTLGCSIEISRDICIYICIYVGMSRCQINCVGGITLPTRMLKVIFGR